MNVDNEILLNEIRECSDERLIPFDLVVTDENLTKFDVRIHSSDAHSTSSMPYGSVMKSSDESFQELIEDHLKVPKELPTDFILKCQIPIQKPIDVTGFIQNRLVTRHSEFVLERDHLGHVISCKEVLLKRPSESQSMEMSREYEAPSGREFWRGTSDGIPFVPGGIDPQLQPHDKLETVIFHDSSSVKDNEEFQLCRMLDELAIKGKDQMQQSFSSASIETGRGQVTSVEIAKITKNTWAHVVNANEIPKDFDAVIPELAFKFPFTLDTFQKQAVYHLERGNCVFVAAHTSAGKTVVAEYAIALAFKHMTKVIYTSPIKALSNQKYRDFKNTFEDVGLLTGDVQIKPEANCLIMTTEILRSMLYKGADILRDVEFVVFDEVHYVNDIDRGHVWEEVIIMLPSHVNLILLSATVPNTFEFADWIGRTKRRDVYVISTLKRPVPLEHHLYLGEGCSEFFKIVDQEKTFLEKNYKAAFYAFRKEDKQKPSSKPSEQLSKGNQGRKSASKNTWIHLINLLKKKSLIPVVMFTFSKKRCDEYANALSSLDLTTKNEKSTIHTFLKTSLSRLNDDDSSLPQISRMCDWMERGIAVHHSGILPILKEAVEILFCKGLVKVLFATETFAMGVNMPAKTVVFTGIKKHDGHSLRFLLPGEYTQMSGRAGRRGLDSTGMVIIYADDMPLDSNLKHMILGAPTKLESQFKLTYNMILNLLRVEALKVEDMMKRSFSENDNQVSKKDVQKHLEESENALKKAEKLSCDICKNDLPEFYSMNVQLLNAASRIHSYFIQQPKNKIFVRGTIIIINNEFYRNVPAVYLRYINIDRNKRIECVPLVLSTATKENEALPFFEWTIPKHSMNFNYYEFKVVQIEVEHILLVTSVSVPIKFSIMGIPNKADLRNLVTNAAECIWSYEGEFSYQIADYFSNCKDVDVASHITKMNGLIRLYNSFHCLDCKNYCLHYSQYHIQRTLAERLADVQHLLTDTSLLLLPEYNQRIQVLKQLNCIDEEENVLLKGRVASEFNTVDELIATELIFENMLKDYQPSEIIALLSCMVFQEKSSTDKNSNIPPKNPDPTQPIDPTDFQYLLEENKGTSLSANLKKGKDMMMQLAIKLASIQKEAGLGITVESYLGTLKWGMLQVVYEWANGVSFKEITKLTDIAEGSIVRCIVRLDETAREVRNAARIIGDTELLSKMEEASLSIKRDICFASSLYF